MENREVRLIDANVFIKDLTAMKSAYDAIALDGMVKALKEAPTIDPESLRPHGKWEFGKSHGDFVEAECSNCRGLLLVKWYDEIDKYRYCPNCGAVMQGVKDE